MRTATGPLGRAWISGLAALLAGGPAMAVEFVDDPVSGSCKALVRQQGSTGVHGRTGTWPGLWGVTEPVLYIGDKRTDEAGVTDGIDADLTEHVVPATRGRPAASCATVKNFRYAFRTETRVTAMQWQHGRKPDSACAKEWDRMRGIIRTHELKHVQDVDDTIRDENTRIAAIRPIEACAATADAAKAKPARRCARCWSRRWRVSRPPSTRRRRSATARSCTSTARSATTGRSRSRT